MEKGASALRARGCWGRQNGIVTINVPPVAPGTITSITFEGRLTEQNLGTYASEACIEVTGPDGAKFVIQPFVEGDFTDSISTDVPIIAPRVVVPIGTRGGGVYTFRFFELYRDNPTGLDGSWSNIFIKFFTGPLPFDTSIAPTTQGPSVVAADWGTVILSSSARTLTIPQTPAAKRVRLKGYATALTGWNSNNSASPQSYVRINFTAPSAATGLPVNWTVTPLPGATLSTGTFDLTVDIPETVLAGTAHPWSYSVTAPNTSASVGPGVAYLLMNVQPLLPDAPIAGDLGVIRSRPFLGLVETSVVATATPNTVAHTVRWTRFVTAQACSDATGYWLDLQSRQPAGSTISDHEIAVYRVDSSVVVQDDDSGPGHLSLLSFGQTSPVRPPVDADQFTSPRAGQSGDLPAGTYYLATAEFDAAFGDGFAATSSGTHLGDMAVDFRTNLPAAPPIPQPFLDIGTLSQGVLDGGIHPASPSAIYWIRFALAQGVSAASGRYLDIHTIGNASPATIDTELGLYNAVGGLMASDDDDGQNGNRSLLTFGGSALRSPVGGSSIRDGRDGSLAVGTYYLGVGLYDMTFNTSVEFGVTSANTTAVQTIPVTIIYGGGCPADLGVQGGAAGQDGRLDNNDFIAFISLFFANDARADMGVQGGGPGHDGHFDNNDFIAFISAFFAGCP
ncbi:MAG: GC-type dockerin domain-anchored protein [Phycisphaerales bacterium]